MNTVCENEENEASSSGETRPENKRRRCGNKEFSPMKGNNGGGETPKLIGKSDSGEQKKKPPFRPAIDDTKPFLKDPILRSDPIETEEAVLRLPPFPFNKTAA